MRMNSERWITAEWNAWMNSSLFLMPNWKWIGLAFAILLGFVVQSILKNIFRKIKKSNWAQSRAHGFLSHFLSTELETPIAWILTSLFWKSTLEDLAVHPGLEKYLSITVHLVLAFYLILLVYRAVEAIGRVLTDFAAKTENTLDDQLAPMATKFLKIIVLIFGVLITLQNFGVNVMSILAGLGLGGLALALAAQDTAANLFGSVTILLDRPFTIGQLIKVGDTEGFVEEIGFRSTRIRTLYKSLITIPNSVMAKEKIDNLGARPMNRIRNVFALTNDTAPEKITAFIKEVEALINAIKQVDPDSVLVTFQAMSDFSLQILANFFVRIPDAPTEYGIQQQFLLDVRKLAQKLEIQFAYPTTTQLVRQISTGTPASLPAEAPQRSI